MNSLRILYLTLFHIRRISYSLNCKIYFSIRHSRQWHTISLFFCHVTLISWLYAQILYCWHTRLFLSENGQVVMIALKHHGRKGQITCIYVKTCTYLWYIWYREEYLIWSNLIHVTGTNFYRNEFMIHSISSSRDTNPSLLVSIFWARVPSRRFASSGSSSSNSFSKARSPVKENQRVFLHLTVGAFMLGILILEHFLVLSKL